MNNKKPHSDELPLVDAIDGDELDLELGNEPTEGDLHLEAQIKDPTGGGRGSGDDDEDGDEDDFSDELDMEYAADIEDAAEAELEDLLRETGGAPLQQRIGGLVIKLAEYPNGEFPISAYSTYGQNTWTLHIDRYGAVKRVSFEGMTEPMRELKKAFTYHFIPDFSPFGNIRSFTTTYSQSSFFVMLEKYLFEPNFLDGSPESLALINHRMLNRALDVAKESQSSRHYHSLYYMIRLWGALSTQGIIPAHLKLNVKLEKVDTVERRKDVIRHFAGSTSTWQPYSEEDLSKLCEYAFFWTDKAMPKLLETVAYVKENELDATAKAAIVRYETDHDVEKNLNISIDGVEIISASKKSYDYEYTTKEQHVYSWLRSYAASVDKVRNAVYILVALVTGLRSGELCILTFDNVTKYQDGSYGLNIKRFKTSDEPSYDGEDDLIPLPRYIGQKIEELEKLRSIYTLKAQNFIFQSTKGRKSLNKPGTHVIQAITRELNAEVAVDRIHTHRFRKTIAEILINRSERNIDIIRHLFGHKSYSMTLKYISRNPHLVRSVAQAIEQNYTAEFTLLLTSIKEGASSGPQAERILDRLKARPNAFAGKQLKVTIYVYISHLLSSGEPLFIHRTALGTYCLSIEAHVAPNLPPCLAHLKDVTSPRLPDPTHCDLSCKHAVVVGKAAQALADNVKFYTTVLENGGDSLTDKAKRLIAQKIESNSRHLETLNRKNNQASQIIPAVSA
ncbi:tyrosine-type recombinase/integrase [Pseudomonas aeruginosa]|uniref:tyrosine-type recombinase/integrase n=1 Tax=Pseudomonas aeruginosa TaxID=287 RepID=UPI00209C4831|nr:tyrosine-type recombinase/integrase [Pseudomonas aeruginosa]